MTPVLTSTIKKTPVPDDYETIPGDTYPLRTELKALGAMWDAAGRVWRIAPDKLALATALVEHQGLIPPRDLPRDENGEVIDPFEQDAQGPRQVALEKQDGATYGARDALKAVGARWDKNQRTWLVREERAEYARAVLSSVAEAPTPPAPVEAPQPSEEHQDAAPVQNVAVPKEASLHATDSPDTQVVDRGIELGGLWQGRDRDGKPYLAGQLSPTARIVIYKNQDRSDDSQPSHIMYLAPAEPEK